MLDKIKAVMLGHAVGDALGVPVEFNDRKVLEKNPVTDMMGYGTYPVPAGTWSDDTSMALCALESMTKGNIDYDDIMRNFCKWYYEANFTATDVVFDIGNTCYDAIYTYSTLNLPAARCGSSNEMSNGNGSLMRIHPFVLYTHCNGIKDENIFVNIISIASALTHAHPCSMDGCIIYAYILNELLSNPSKESVYKGLSKAKKRVNTHTPYYHRLFNTDISMAHKSTIKSSGYIVDSLEAAIWCLLTTESYSECVLKAVNLGGDTDTIAAIAGGLAGALYGLNSIPSKWLTVLKKTNYIEDMCENAYDKWR